MSQENSCKNFANANNLNIIDVSALGNSITISFVSGEGEVYDYLGEEKNPLCFTVQIFPSSDKVRKDLLEIFKLWADNSDPISLFISDGNTVVKNNNLNFSIEVTL
jgi:hypothetical protein